MKGAIDKFIRRLPWSKKRDVLSVAGRDAIIARLNPLQDMEVQWGSKNRVHYGEKVVIELDQSVVGVTPQTTSAQVGTYILKSVQGDYLTCRTWDGTTWAGLMFILLSPTSSGFQSA